MTMELPSQALYKSTDLMRREVIHTRFDNGDWPLTLLHLCTYPDDITPNNKSTSLVCHYVYFLLIIILFQQPCDRFKGGGGGTHVFIYESTPGVDYILKVN